MPVFGFSDTITINTAEIDKNKLLCKLTQGIITQVILHFPAGCDGLARCQLYRGDYQIFPISPGSYFALDDITLPLNVFYPLDTKPYEMNWHTWNIDDTHNHTLQVYLVVLPPELVLPLSGLPEYLETLKDKYVNLYKILTGEEEIENAVG